MVMTPGFEMELVTLHLFQRLTNIDQRLRNSREHAGSITAPLRHLPVTESFALPPDLKVECNDRSSSRNPAARIHRLRCPKCRTRMMLTRISPVPGGFELRTLDCSKCDHVEKIVIASFQRSGLKMRVAAMRTAHLISLN